MKILKPGKMKQDYHRDATCCRCKCEVRLEREDVLRRMDSGDGPTRPAYYFWAWSCPECEEGNRLKDEDGPFLKASLA